MSTATGAWMPIATRSGFGKSRFPQKVEVCGHDFALWQSAEGEYSVVADVCPHRLAPLSQGRVDESGRIECPYHGMAFDGCGTCTSVPQLPSDAPVSAKLKATGFETHLTGDLIWAFFPTEFHGESLSASITPEDLYGRHIGETKGQYYVRELPYSWDMLVENFMDPSHIPHAHHSLQGVRSDGCPIPMKTLVMNETHVEASFEDVVRGKPRTGIVSVRRPVRYHFRTLDKDGSTYVRRLEIFCVPVREGYARVFFSTPIPKWVPIWLAHAGSNRFLNTDIWLHDAERTLRKVKNNEASSDADLRKYVTASTADLGPNCFRQWWRKFGMSAAPRHSFGPSIQAPRRIESRKELIDTWRWHSQYCAPCREALKKAKRVRQISLAFGIILLSMPLTFVQHLSGLALSSASFFLSNKVISAIRGYEDIADVPDRSVAALADDDKKADARLRLRKENSVA